MIKESKLNYKKLLSHRKKSKLMVSPFFGIWKIPPNNALPRGKFFRVKNQVGTTGLSIDVLR